MVGLKRSQRKAHSRGRADAPVGNVEVAQAESVPMKRFTVDVPESLHRRIKAQCAMRGTKMADEIRALLEKHYAIVKA